MATLNSAVQAMVDNLHAKMTADPAELTAQEQTLIANALQALHGNASWEQALVAVATEHLNTATDTIEAASNQATSDIGDAQTALATASSNAVASISGAQSDLNAAAGELTASKSVLDAIGGLTQNPFGNMHNTYARVPYYNLIKGAAFPNTNFGALGPVMTIFSSDGETLLMKMQPDTHTSMTVDWYEQSAGASRVVDPFTREDYCSSSDQSGDVRDTHADKKAYYGAFGVAKLASSTDPDDIQTKKLIMDATTSTANSNRFIGFYNDSSYSLAAGAGHYNNAAVRDKYGRYATWSSVSTSSDRAQSYFYDNETNTVTVIQDLRVWRLYNDGWVDTGITFANIASAQAWIDAQTDIFLVPMYIAGYGQYYMPERRTHISSASESANTAFQYKYSHMSVTGAASLNELGRVGGTPYADLPGPNWNMGIGFVTDQAGGPHSHGNPSSAINNHWNVSQSYLWDADEKNLIPLERRMTFEQRLYSPLPESNSSKWRAIKVTTQFNRLDTGDLIKEIVMNLPNHVELTYMRESYYCVGFPHYNPYTDIAYVHALGGGNSGQPYWEWLSPWAAPDFHRHI